MYIEETRLPEDLDRHALGTNVSRHDVVRDPGRN